MKKNFQIPLLLILPVILFLTCSLLQKYQGPYFTNSQYDPSYVYLISSLNLSHFSGYGVEHIDHPGTPVQVIGAIVIKLSHFVTGEKISLAEDVLLNPEKYLSEIDFTFLLINCLGLFILGIVAYKIYSDLILSLLLQFTPFTSISILSMLTLVRPENFMFFVVCILISVLILFLNIQNKGNSNFLKYVILTGIICGLGIATKITFIPLILIPLIIFPGIKYKLLFLSIIIFSFLIFVIPALSYDNVNYFVNWVYSLFINNKKYGRGEPTVVDTYTFFRSIKKILIKEWIFDAAYISVAAATAIILLRKFKTVFVKIKNIVPDGISDNTFKLITGIFFAMSSQILIVAKHYGENYMFPVLVISVFSIFISIKAFQIFPGKFFTKGKLNFIYLLVMLLISVFTTTSLNSYSKQLKIQTEESDKMINFVENNFSNFVIVSSHHVPSREFALMAGISYSVSKESDYKLILKPANPKRIFLSGEKLISFHNEQVKTDSIINTADKIIFLCPDETYREQFLKTLTNEYGISNVVFEKIFSNMNGEMVYEVKLKKF